MKVGPVPIQSQARAGAATAPATGHAPAGAWAEPNPFYSPELLEPALATLDPGGDARVIDALDSAGTLIGRLPVVADTVHGRFPIRHTVNWLHRHCFYGAPLLRAGREDEAWSLLLRALDAAPWSGSLPCQLGRSS